MKFLSASIAVVLTATTSLVAQQNPSSPSSEAAYERMQQQRAIQRNNELREMKRRLALQSPPPPSVSSSYSTITGGGLSNIKVTAQPRPKPAPVAPAPRPTPAPAPVAKVETPPEKSAPAEKRRTLFGSWKKASQTPEEPAEPAKEDRPPAPAPALDPEPEPEPVAAIGPVKEEVEETVVDEPKTEPTGLLVKLFGKKSAQPEAPEIEEPDIQESEAVETITTESTSPAPTEEQAGQVIASVGDWNRGGSGSFAASKAPSDSLLRVVNTTTSEFFPVEDARVSETGQPLAEGTVVLLIRGGDEWASVELATGDRGIIRGDSLRLASNRESPAFYIARSEGVPMVSNQIEQPISAPTTTSQPIESESSTNSASEVGFGLLPPASE